MFNTACNHIDGAPYGEGLLSQWWRGGYTACAANGNDRGGKVVAFSGDAGAAMFGVFDLVAGLSVGRDDVETNNKQTESARKAAALLAAMRGVRGMRAPVRLETKKMTVAGFAGGVQGVRNDVRNGLSVVAAVNQALETSRRDAARIEEEAESALLADEDLMALPGRIAHCVEPVLAPAAREDQMRCRSLLAGMKTEVAALNRSVRLAERSLHRHLETPLTQNIGESNAEKLALRETDRALLALSDLFPALKEKTLRKAQMSPRAFVPAG